MTPPSIASALPPIDSTQRKLMTVIVVSTLLAFTLLVADLASGGRPDPPALRAAATLLDGAWQFRVGDDPRWAGPGIADAGIEGAGWEAIDLTPVPGSHDGDVGLPDYVGGWMARGHPGYHGYAWYRRTVAVPATHASWEILGPTLVEDGYELYWNGRRLGGSGRLGPDPRVVGTRPLRFPLPADAAGSAGVLAIRAYMRPGPGGTADGGGLHSAPILAPQPVAAALHRAQWARTIAGYIVDVVEPLAMLALIGLALASWSRSSRKGFVAHACLALALTAARRLDNAIVSWTDLQALATYAWLASVMWVPTMAAWLLAWNRWCERRWRSVDGLAIALAVVAIAGVLEHRDGWVAASRVGAIGLFAAIAMCILRSGPMRALAIATLAFVVAGLFGGELLDPLGVPGIWFPFGIGVSRTQYLYAIGIPLLAFLVVRTLRPKPDPALMQARSRGTRADAGRVRR